MTITVTDDDGAEGTVAVLAMVRNVAPVIHPPPSPSANQGQQITVPVTFTDPGADTWEAYAEHGDGTSTRLQLLRVREFTLQHTYARPGTYSLLIRVWDNDSGQQTITVPVVIRNVPPTVSFQGATLNEGSTLSVFGSFSDPSGQYDTYTLTVDYGDGTGVQPLSRSGTSFYLFHAYAENGSFPVTVTVTDASGGVGQATATAVVNNVAPRVSLESTSITAPEGSPLVIRGSFTDPGTRDTWTATVNYGDGTGAQPLSFEAARTRCRSQSWTATARRAPPRRWSRCATWCPS